MCKQMKTIILSLTMMFIFTACSQTVQNVEPEDFLTQKGQFCGYWKQSRSISESDIQIAEETLDKWYANDCKLLSDYLFFCAGPNREHLFRVKY